MEQQGQWVHQDILQVEVEQAEKQAQEVQHHQAVVELLEPILADAAVFKQRHSDRGSDWLYETLALFKYQAEGAHERLDELTDILRKLHYRFSQIMGSSTGFGEPEDDSDWWKK